MSVTPLRAEVLLLIMQNATANIEAGTAIANRELECCGAWSCDHAAMAREWQQTFDEALAELRAEHDTAVPA